MRNVIALDDIETSVSYSFTNDKGVEKTRQKAVKLRKGSPYSVDDETRSRLIGLGLVEDTDQPGAPLV